MISEKNKVAIIWTCHFWILKLIIKCTYARFFYCPENYLPTVVPSVVLLYVSSKIVYWFLTEIYDPKHKYCHNLYDFSLQYPAGMSF